MYYLDPDLEYLRYGEREKERNFHILKGLTKRSSVCALNNRSLSFLEIEKIKFFLLLLFGGSGVQIWQFLFVVLIY